MTLQEAVLGGKVPVPTLTGTVSLSIPAEFEHGPRAAPQGQGHPGASDSRPATST